MKSRYDSCNQVFWMYSGLMDLIDFDNEDDAEVGLAFKNLYRFYLDNKKLKPMTVHEQDLFDSFLLCSSLEQPKRKNSLPKYFLQKKNKGYKRKTYRRKKVPENQKDRYSSKAAKWRKDVFEKDGYRCCICKQTGGKLNAHHIKPWAEYPELRFDVNNGDTLCESCHREIHRRMRLRQKVK